MAEHKHKWQHHSQSGKEWEECLLCHKRKEVEKS